MLIYTALIPSVYLCGYVQLQYLYEHGFILLRTKHFSNIRKEDIFWSDIVFFIRNDSAQDVWLAKQCHRAGKYLIYVLDDDLLNVPPYITSASYYRKASVQNQIREIMYLSDCFVSPSAILLDKYGGQFSHAFSIIEPATMQVQKKKPQIDGKVHIGFAGSVDRGKDVEDILSGAIEKVLQKYSGQINIEVFGPETELSKRLGLKTYAYRDSYSDYQMLMKHLNWDIGLAPMPDTPFHRCKHFNKLVEYSGFGIVGVYSDVIPYSTSIENGVTGLLCENTEQAWANAISCLIEHDTLRRTMQSNCLRLAKETYSVEKAAMELMRQIEICGPKRQAKSNLRFFEIRKSGFKLIGIVKRAVRVIFRG